MLSAIEGGFSFPTLIISAIIGGLIALIPVWIKVKHAQRSDIIKLAVDTAHKDFEVSQDIALKKEEDTYPMSAYISFHYIFLSSLEAGNSPKVALNDTLNKMAELMPEYNDKQFSDYRTKWKTDPR